MSEFFSEATDKYIKGYASWALSMLTSPSSIVTKTRVVIEEKTLIEHLTTVLIPTVLIGITLGALIPNRPAFASRTIVFLVLSFLWLFISLLVHFFCRLLGGKEPAETTVALMVQILAFAYVVSNFITLLAVWMLTAYSEILGGISPELSIAHTVINEPAIMLFSIQFITILCMVPFIVSYAHGFRGVALLAVGFFAAVFAVVFGFPVYAQHGC